MKGTGGSSVNKVGKYLYSKFDSRDSIKFQANKCKVYFTLYYQLSEDRRIADSDDDVNKMHEMQMCIDLTTYSNSLRVEIIEISPEECTISYLICDEKLLDNLDVLRAKILNKLRKDISKRYVDYDFIF